MRHWLALTALALLAACAKPAEQQATQPAVHASQAAPVTSPSTSRDPARVLVAWAEVMSLKQWSNAYRYWQNNGAGLTEAQFAAKWGKLSNPEFEIHPGKFEGAAGSSFYTAPVVLIDGARQTKGKVVLRRVNDVPGSDAEQLRWHIESMTIEP